MDVIDYGVLLPILAPILAGTVDVVVGGGECQRLVASRRADVEARKSFYLLRIPARYRCADRQIRPGCIYRSGILVPELLAARFF